MAICTKVTSTWSRPVSDLSMIPQASPLSVSIAESPLPYPEGQTMTRYYFEN
jgi:hypothetical protein